MHVYTEGNAASSYVFTICISISKMYVSLDLTTEVNLSACAIVSDRSILYTIFYLFETLVF